MASLIQMTIDHATIPCQPSLLHSTPADIRIEFIKRLLIIPLIDNVRCTHVRSWSKKFGAIKSSNAVLMYSTFLSSTIFFNENGTVFELRSPNNYNVTQYIVVCKVINETDY